MAISNAVQHAHNEYVEIETLYGKQVVDKASLLNFPEGLAGFEDLHEFKLFHEEGASMVYYLQSTEDPYIRFPLVPADACHSLAREISVAFLHLLEDRDQRVPARIGVLGNDRPDVHRTAHLSFLLAKNATVSSLIVMSTSST